MFYFGCVGGLVAEGGVEGLGAEGLAGGLVGFALVDVGEGFFEVVGF